MDIENENVKRGILENRNVPLILNSYTDIFSDFDPRPFTERALSDDFLMECRRAVRDKEGGFELILSMPKNLRDLNHEFQIKKRLREHFHKHFLIEETEMNQIRNAGFIWIIIGAIINVLVVSGLINFDNNVLLTILGIFEIPSWFLIWEGLSKILIHSKENKPDYEFYKKMSIAQITFRNY